MSTPIALLLLGEGGGQWTMANQLYVKSGESPHVTLAGKEESALPKHFLPKYLAEKVIDAL